MAGGYMGKVIKVDLDANTVTTIDSTAYNEKYGGAHGVGTAIFWDLAVEPGTWDLKDGFDSRNVISLMAGPLGGTITPLVGRMEVQAVGVYPLADPANLNDSWWTRSGFGGRFNSQIKAAGWDGIVVVGKASSPVWINIINDNVTIEDASDLWGMDTYEAQQEIWRRVAGEVRFGDWLKLPGGEYSTQRPAVTTCGPAGENLARVATLVSETGSGAGQGGMGAVFGSKNLKAISAIGTGSVEVADPEELNDARTWIKTFQYNVDNPVRPMMGRYAAAHTSGAPYFEERRATGCVGCMWVCRSRFQSGINNESQCVEAGWFSGANSNREKYRATDLLQRMGINAWAHMKSYLRDLYQMGELGSGKTIESAPVDMERYGSYTFAEQLMRATAYKEGIGEFTSQGDARAAIMWGRYVDDTDSGLLQLPQWGYHWHHTALPTWAYGSLLGDRDLNEHAGDYEANSIGYRMLGTDDEISPENFANILAQKMPPYDGDPYMFDYQDGRVDMDQALETGIYSKHGAKHIAAHRHYSRFQQQGLNFCCLRWPIFMEYQKQDLQGAAPEAGPRFFNAVTGLNYNYEDFDLIGRRVWNMDRAIWILQGRHRDLEVFTGSMSKAPGHTWGNRFMSVYRNGVWDYETWNQEGPVYDVAGTEVFKDNYYELEGWEKSTGWPSRATLEDLDLGFVADKLESEGKLGATGTYIGPAFA